MTLNAKKFVLICFFSALSFVLFVGCDPFEVGEEGCPMAHCDAQMSDNPKLPAPKGPNVDIHKYSPDGSIYGLGCVSNGTRAACSFISPAALRVYDYQGNEIWRTSSSNAAVNYLDPAVAWMSAPIIDKKNHVIAADDKHIMRFDQAGNVIWKAAIPAGQPISPVPDGRGLIFIGTKNGPVATFVPDVAVDTDQDGDGIHSHIDSKWVVYDMVGAISLAPAEPPFNPPTYNMYYQVDNTPAFKRDGKRVYITMAKKKWPKQGELVALDIDDSGAISLAWTYHFQSPSGASPLVVEDLGAKCGPERDRKCGPVIYFDGRYDAAGVEAAKIFAIEDVPKDHWNECYPPGQPCGRELWTYNVDPPTTTPPSDWLLPAQKTIDASFTADPVNRCMWYYASTWYEMNTDAASDPHLYCLDYEMGDVTLKVDPGTLLGQAFEHRYAPSGLIMMAQDPNDDDQDGESDRGPVLIFNDVGAIGTAAGGNRANKIIAFRPDKSVPNHGRKLWEKDLPDNKGYINVVMDSLLGGGLTKSTQGQIAILNNPDPADAAGTRIIFTTNSDGIHIIGD